MPYERPYRERVRRRFDDATVEVIGNVADEAVALFTTAQDMSRAASFWRLSESQEAPESDVREALWLAGVVTYARCFKQGTTKAIAHRVPIPVQQRDEHGYLLRMRDEYVAHAGRSRLGEDGTVVIRLLPGSRTEVAFRGQAYTSRLAANTSLRLAAQIALADHLAAAFEQLGKDALDAIVGEVEKLNAGDLLGKTRGRGHIRIDSIT